MRVFYYLGFMLLMLAFASGAAEVVPRTFTRGEGGGFVSAYDLLYAAWPGKLVVAQIHVEKLSSALWDPILTGLLAMLVWLLLGLPGGALAWVLPAEQGNVAGSCGRPQKAGRNPSAL